MFEVAGVFAQEMFSDTVGKDRNVILYVLGPDQALGAVGGTGAQEVLIVGFEQIDGFDFDGRGGELMKVEDGLFVFENLRVYIGAANRILAQPRLKIEGICGGS